MGASTSHKPLGLHCLLAYRYVHNRDILQPLGGHVPRVFLVPGLVSSIFNGGATNLYLLYVLPCDVSQLLKAHARKLADYTVFGYSGIFYLFNYII
jgi:hypothetical protein